MLSSNTTEVPLPLAWDRLWTKDAHSLYHSSVIVCFHWLQWRMTACSRVTASGQKPQLWKHLGSDYQIVSRCVISDPGSFISKSFSNSSHITASLGDALNSDTLVPESTVSTLTVVCPPPPVAAFRRSSC